MFDFRNEVIINSNLDIDGVTKKFEYTDRVKGSPTRGKVIRIRRVGDYCPTGIAKVADVPTVFFEAGYKGTMEVVELDLTSVTIPAGKIKLNLEVVMLNSANSQYSSQGNKFRTRPFSIEVDNETECADAATKKEFLNRVRKLIIANQTRFDNQFFSVPTEDVAGVKLSFTASDERMKFITLGLMKYDATGLNGVLGKYVTLGSQKPVIKTAGKQSFGTYDYMAKNIQIQTAERTGYLAQSQDEKVVPGATYDKFTFRYVMTSQLTGFSAVGSQNTSVTTHVFWVKSDLTAEFKKLFTDATVTIDTVSTNVTSATVELSASSVAVGSNITVTITTSPTGGNYILKSSDPKVASVSGNKVTGVKAGTCKIIATVEDGVTAEADLTVTAAG